ncbi:portal protein [Lysobacter soli]|uniref:portal protein n=1 Tax=Lysobacter soli TaxID=453783 RepID=UPI0037C6879E
MPRKSALDSTPRSKDHDALELMRTRYDKARELSDDPYQLASDDIRFVTKPGAQWDEKLKARRKDRPMYEFPKLQGHVRQVVNEMRQSRPQGKVRGVEEGDTGLAEIMQGICRNIESTSNSDHAYDTAFDQAVKGGLGWWRICTDYASDDDFDLDIVIKPIRNFASVKIDPAAVEIDRRDARFAFVEELIPESEFERRYPGASIADFYDDKRAEKWREAGQVRVAEYIYKEPQKRELWAVESRNGVKVVFADEAGITEEELPAAGLRLVKRRTVESHKVMVRITNGHEFLTEPYEFPSKFIPLIPVWGNIDNIDGEDYWQGMVRGNKDSQRLHNVHRTAMVEAIAKAPKAPFVTKPKWVKGFEQQWYAANSEDRPVLFVDDNAEQLPQRTQQAEVPVALIQAAALDNDDIKAGTGQFNPSLGAQSNASSGRAINSLKMAGATATFNYIDNLVYAIRYQYEILVDMIPRVYDTQRVVRLLGEDGGEKWKTLYQEVTDPVTGQTRTLNDISKGKYDVTVTVGPAYATQRMEAAEAFTQLVGQLGSSVPPLVPLLAYQAISNMDLPGTEEVSTALRKMLVSQGALPPKEGEEPPQPQQPNPIQVAQVRKATAEADESEAKAEKARAEAMATLPTAHADVRKTNADAAKTEMEIWQASNPMPALTDFMG